jgi:hypothetical protein
VILYESFYGVENYAMEGDDSRRWFSSLREARTDAKKVLLDAYDPNAFGEGRPSDDYIEIEQISIGNLPKKKLALRLLNRERYVAARKVLERWTLSPTGHPCRTPLPQPSEAASDASAGSASTTK